MRYSEGLDKTTLRFELVVLYIVIENGCTVRVGSAEEKLVIPIVKMG